MEIIFLKYLLVPIVVMLAMVAFGLYAKVNTLLRPGRLILFVLIVAVILALPALTGLMTYNFIPFGLVAVQVLFFALGIGMVWFSRTNLYQSIGLGGNIAVQLAAYLVALLLGSWAFFLLFEFLGQLHYSLWVATLTVWFLLPVFYAWGDDAFSRMPPPYYETLDPSIAARYDDTIWDNADYLRMMNISLNIKRSVKDSGYSSYPVKAPAEVEIGQWFLRYIKDQRIRFPNAPIETESEGKTYTWIFYTTRFFIFNRPLSPTKTFQDYKIRNQSEIYARRVHKIDEMPTT
ncbi:MAG: hypothetical protein RLZZ165_173 [Bacteroidota bacterium]|jgi:hypothetical protein